MDVFCLFLKVSLFILRDRKRGWVSRGEAERKGERENLHCWHRARLGTWTHELWDHDLCGYPESDAEPPEPSRCPWKVFLIQLIMHLSMTKEFHCLFTQKKYKHAHKTICPWMLIAFLIIVKNLEVTQTSINRRKDKRIVVYSQNRMWFSNKKWQ